MIRTYTGGEFDHAAMVLKLSDSPDKTWLLEATGGDGVHLTSYEDSVRPLIGTFYPKVAVRHLSIADNLRENSLDIVDQFLDEAIGSRYDFSLRKLWHHRS